MKTAKLSFSSDYMFGAHPKVMAAIEETNSIPSDGYGLDEFSEAARDLIRDAVGVPDAEIHFLVGGTQVNKTFISAALQSYQGVIAAESAHIETHEAGAIEFGGHRVITVEPEDDGTLLGSGKVCPDSIIKIVKRYNEDDNHDHMVMPGMVYISQPTESGCLYSLAELEELSRICRENGLLLYLDGARLAYALACPENDAGLGDIARLCDAFYIGGTKCGALFGEALVIPKKDLVPHLFTIIKQHGALIAKGMVTGAEFKALFGAAHGSSGSKMGSEGAPGSSGSKMGSEGAPGSGSKLYDEIGRTAISAADEIRRALKDKGYELANCSPTNQIFIVITAEERARLEEHADLGFWDYLEDGRVMVRIATSWATTEEDVEQLIDVL